MSLEATYKQFLAAPSPDLLADNASIHYITTLVSVNGPDKILKYFADQVDDLRKTEERFLNVVEGRNSLAAEVHTSIEFIAGGGAYLPKLDDNFLADRIVTLPIVHFVKFDEDGRIQQVRMSWDQGSLLKLIDVIGKTGRNWPIHAGKDQIHLISASIKSSGKSTGESTTEEEDDAYTRARGNSQNALRDPHASLELFTPRKKAEVVAESLPAVVARRASAKPPQRDYRDLFVGNDSDQSATASPARPETEAEPSPAKPAVVGAKAGAGRNYAPSRLFETDEPEEEFPVVEKPQSTDHAYRPNPAKYKHFEFADGTDPQDAPKPAPVDGKRSKHGSQWNFEDFATPAKTGPAKVGRNDVVHWGNEDDEVVDSPVKQKHVLKPRKDTQTNIEFQDDGGAEGGDHHAHRNRGASHNTGLGLYKNNVYDEDQRGDEGVDNTRRLDTISNVKDRSKDFDPHFTMTDDSPAAKPAVAHVSEDRAKVIKMMGASWTENDESLDQKENLPTATSKPVASHEPLAETTNKASKHGDKSQDVTAGDGMGGKKGSGRSWGIGDDSDGEGASFASRPSKYNASRNRPTGGDFWDF